jgi:hypothetical protein
MATSRPPPGMMSPIAGEELMSPVATKGYPESATPKRSA